MLFTKSNKFIIVFKKQQIAMAHDNVKTSAVFCMHSTESKHKTDKNNKNAHTIGISFR